MRRYIFTQRNGIHIIDLQQTMGLIGDAYRAMVELAASGGKVLFVGTKKQAQDVIASEAERTGQWYVNQRWLGGTLTNFQTIKGRIDHMKRLPGTAGIGLPGSTAQEGNRPVDPHAGQAGEVFHRPAQHGFACPAALFVIDIGKEDICIAEARRLNIPIFAIVDTDCDPGLVTHAVPGNDDAVRSIRLITGRMASAIEEGQAQREALLVAQAESDASEDGEMDEDRRPFSNTVTLEELGHMMSSRPLEP